ncbi:MAG: putative NAD/FAD-binding protein [Planctomycetota bacterium]|jgi:predicted NAD/FAD-binding protein
MKIAIIGSGISGLVAAHKLHKEHDITVFEANDRIGGHTHTVGVRDSDQMVGVDTGFIVYNETTYPYFTKLLRELEVETQPTEMSFSVTCRKSGLEYNGSSLRQLFVQKRNIFRPSFYRMIREILRFNRLTAEVFATPNDTRTIREFVTEYHFQPQFIDHYLVPLGASLWSCSASKFLDFPLSLVVRFLENHGMNTVDNRPEWRVIKGGSQKYVDKIIRPFADRILVNTPVRSIRRTDTSVEITAANRAVEEFDHVVVACHSNQALRMLADPSPVENEMLSEFPYQANKVFLHTDTAILPKRKKAWASWNYHIPQEPQKNVSVTYDMNILQTLKTEEVYCVTLNDSFPIRSDSVIKEIDYEHPLYTVKGMEAQNRHHELINQNRTSFCGAYWGNGFHEDGVRSALAVVEGLRQEVLV